MKIFIISNTMFGYKNVIESQLNYFNNIFITYLKNNYNNGDIFIHGGNIFNDKKTVSMDIINNVMDIFEKISKILPVYILKTKNDIMSSILLSRINNVEIIDNIKEFDNISVVSYNKNITELNNNDIIIFNSDYYSNSITNKKILKNKFDISICTTYSDRLIKDDNIINIGSPYQLTENDKEKKGFLVLSTSKKKIKFITNKYSPKYIKYIINNIEDLNNNNLSNNDYIILKINEKLLNDKKTMNLINIFINRIRPINITYFKDNDIKIENPIEMSNNLYNIEEMINNYINEHNLDLKSEIDNIINIYKETY